MHAIVRSFGAAMALNRSPLEPITQEHIDTYRRDGVVCLRRVCNAEWIERLLPLATRLAANKEDFGLLPSYPGPRARLRITARRGGLPGDGIERGAILLR
jgi:hypothetical protein